MPNLLVRRRVVGGEETRRRGGNSRFDWLPSPLRVDAPEFDALVSDYQQEHLKPDVNERCRHVSGLRARLGALQVAYL